MVIFSASSIAHCPQELETKFEARYPETQLEFVFAGSQVLAIQIVAGAQADVSISAAFDQMQRVEGFCKAVLLVGNPLIAVHVSSFDAQSISKAVEHPTRFLFATRMFRRGSTRDRHKEKDCVLWIALMNRTDSSERPADAQ